MVLKAKVNSAVKALCQPEECAQVPVANCSYLVDVQKRWGLKFPQGLSHENEKNTLHMHKSTLLDILLLAIHMKVAYSFKST